MQQLDPVGQVRRPLHQVAQVVVVADQVVGQVVQVAPLRRAQRLVAAEVARQVVVQGRHVPAWVQVGLE